MSQGSAFASGVWNAAPVRRRIVVLGATGRTGRLVADELSGSSQVVLVGRDGRALEEVGERSGLPTATSTLDDLAWVLQPGDVVLNLIGPFDVLGDHVVEAVVTANATYLDVAAEPAFLARIHQRHGPAAAHRGVTLLPALGYEGATGHLVADGALEPVGESGASVQVAYLTRLGSDPGGAGARRALARRMTQPTVTYHRGRHHPEHVGARRSAFTAAGSRHHTVSLGGAEIWSLPLRHPSLSSVDVHTGWFGPLGPAVSLSTRLAGPFRALGGDRLVDQALRVLGDGPTVLPGAGASRVVARVRSTDGTTIARREAVGGSPTDVTARLAAAAADRLALADLRDLPVGVTDPLAVFGGDGLAELCSWAGVVVL